MCFIVDLCCFTTVSMCFHLPVYQSIRLTVFYLENLSVCSYFLPFSCVFTCLFVFGLSVLASLCGGSPGGSNTRALLVQARGKYVLRASGATCAAEFFHAVN